MDDLEKHKSECEGEELAWTSSCFDRTLEEFNAIRETHPEVDIHVQESDGELLEQQVEQQVEQGQEEENVAREDIPTGVYGGLCQFSSTAIKAVFLFIDVINCRLQVLMKDTKCLKALLML